MSLSYVLYSGTGSVTNFSVPFPYVDKSHVLATVNDVTTSITWVNSTTVSISPAPANGAIVKIYRKTPTAAPIVDFQNGAIVTEEQLNTSAKQALYVAQEATDKTDSLIGTVSDLTDEAATHAGAASTDAATAAAAAATATTQAGTATTAAGTASTAATTASTASSTSATNATTASTAATTATTQAGLAAVSAAAALAAPGVVFTCLVDDNTSGLVVINTLGVPLFNTSSTKADIATLQNRPGVTGIASFLVDDASPGELIIVGNTGAIFSRAASSTGTQLGAIDVASTYDATTRVAVQQKLGVNRACLSGDLGQSLALQGGDPINKMLIQSTALYPGNVKMPSAGMWTAGRTWSSAVDAFDQFYDNNHLPLPNSTGAVQTITAAFWNQMYANIFGATGIAANIGGFIEGTAGTSIDHLGPGSDPFENIANNLARYRDYYVTRGMTCFLGWMRWIQGEEDLLTKGGEAYAARLIYIQRSLTELARRILNQDEEVILYVEQRSKSPTGFASTYDVADMQIEIARRCPSTIRALPATYDLLYVGGTHMDSPNYFMRDLRAANWVFQDYFRGIAPFTITKSSRTAANAWLLEIAVPTPPLVLDTSGTIITVTGLDWSHGATAANSAGFEFNDNSGSAATSPYVNSVTIVDNGSTLEGRALVAITTAGGTSGTGAPTGFGKLELVYAGRAGAGTGYDTGARGLLRDSATLTSPVDRTGASNTFNLYNWMLRVRRALEK